jgi:cytochrome o ubiquinol oxidase subunit 1
VLGGIVCQIIQLYVSIRDRESLRDLVGDPWDGRTLEWSTTSPPPEYNFAVLPRVDHDEYYWMQKQEAARRETISDEPHYVDIEMPRNSPTGFVSAFLATVMGFALIWQIWWLVAVAFVGAYATFVVFAWRDHDEHTIPAEVVARSDRARRAARAEALRSYAPR